MRDKRFACALLFGAGVFTLEGSSSFLHAVVLRDLPHALLTRGVGLGWMLRADALLSVLAAVFFTLGCRPSLSYLGTKAARFRAYALGFVFALLIELLNWALPNALLTPESVLSALVAWSCFIGGAVFAARLVQRGQHAHEARVVPS
ncbi:hypothetical protein [Tahibacter amnicola]|uniref:Uncharacterized protein n=1 Tax=Tahibacter amnicola TaxID=2976241 RepID=A0ABY6BHQ4_9GAMM|nr:hypothetical protein [Tahibacter amnicola]UXI69533.1 hypothetical protein N4264_07780 [Tahibacter amnicola]